MLIKKSTSCHPNKSAKNTKGSDGGGLGIRNRVFNIVQKMLLKTHFLKEGQPLNKPQAGGQYTLQVSNRKSRLRVIAIVVNSLPITLKFPKGNMNKDICDRKPLQMLVRGIVLFVRTTVESIRLHTSP